MQKISHLVFFFFFFLILFFSPVFAEQTEIIREVQEKPVRFIREDKQKFYFHSLYEYSWIKQGSRKGDWRQFSNRVAYLKDNLQVLYVDSIQYERLGIKDNTIDFGSYQKTPGGYAHLGFGFGSDETDFTYKFKSLVEIEQRLAGNLSINLDGRFLHYDSDSSGNVYLFSPSLIQYFGNNYISAGYGVSYTESRDSAHFGTLKGAFALNEKINLWGGTAVGERLFDIDVLKADQQFGYVFFAGIDVSLTKNFALRLGGSYSKEQPSFIKRSIDFGARLKF